jgi:hypothetical protein
MFRDLHGDPIPGVAPNSHPARQALPITPQVREPVVSAQPLTGGQEEPPAAVARGKFMPKKGGITQQYRALRIDRLRRLHQRFGG